MSIAELTAPRLPRHTGRSLRRRVSATRKVVRSTLRRTRRRTVSTVLSWHRRQFYLTTAYRDARQAIARNEDIFLGSLLLVAIVLFAFASTSSQLGLFLYMNVYLLSDQLGLSLIPIIFLFSVSIGVLALWVAAWMANLVSIALMDGANRRTLTSLRYTVRRSLMNATRTASSWLLYIIVVCAPAALISLWGLIYLVFATYQTDSDVILTILIAGIPATAWMLYALTSYGLMPHVAIFEPTLPLTKTLQRSRQLVVRRGRPFILSLYFLCGLCIAASYQASILLSDALHGTSSLLFYGVIALMLFAMRLGMTMLYRKRKLARR